jgi:plastocyanin
VIAALTAAALLGAATHDVAIGPGYSYTPQGLRIAEGDTVRWQASPDHPLVLQGEAGGPYAAPQERTFAAAGQQRFACDIHGGSGMRGVVTVGAFNTAPTIAVTRETAAPAAGRPVAFRATAGDPEQLPLRIDWDMDGDGTYERSGAGSSVSATFQPGTRTVRARAVDDLGAAADAAHTFTVPGGSLPGGAPPADVAAPAIAVAAPRSLSARRLRRRGVAVRLTPSEDGRVVAELRTRAGRRLARATADARAGETTTLRLRWRGAKPRRLRLRVVALDAAGNRATVTRALRLRRGR